jgi:capsular polysaccharide biosynthesis protein
VIEKALEAFFRHVLLVVLPLLVIPLIVTAYVLATPPQYEAQAGAWVERATYLTYSSTDVNQYLSPAMNQRNRLAELLQTRSFRADVVGKTALAALTTTTGGDDELAQIFARDFDILVTGDHLLVVRFRSEDRAVAIQVLNSVIDAFRLRVASDRNAQAQVAISFYQAQLTDADGQLATARTDLAKVVASSPAVVAALARGGIELARLDPQFADAQRRVDSAQSSVDSARTSLARAQLDVSAGVEGDLLGFRLTDPTQASPTASRQVKKIVIYPLLAVLAALVLSASILVLLTLADHSVRSLADLSPDAVVLGVLPHLRPRGLARGAGANSTRRAVAFVAGTPLPLRDSGRRAS